MTAAHLWTTTLLLVPSFLVSAQEGRGGLPDVSSTLKGTLVLPVPIGNPLFSDITQSVGQIDGAVQFPVLDGLSLGVGGKMTWFGIEERALAPLVTTGEVRRLAFYGKVAYEQYMGENSFYELSGRAGLAGYAFDCPTCPEGTQDNVLHWGLGAAYYLHATENLAFGIMLGYESDAHTFGAADLGLEGFPGRHELSEARNFRYMVFGMGFSTRLRRSTDNARGW